MCPNDLRDNQQGVRFVIVGRTTYQAYAPARWRQGIPIRFYSASRFSFHHVIARISSSFPYRSIRARNRLRCYFLRDMEENFMISVSLA